MSAFSQYVAALLQADAANDVWTRPAEWLALPALADTDDRTVILYRVEDGGYNTVALKAQGNYTVDWGDGSAPEDFASGVQAEHTYTYDDADLLASEMSDGAQQAIISITPQATYSLTKLELHVRPSAAAYGYYASGIMDVAVSGPSMTVFRFGRTDSSTSVSVVDFPHLRQCSLYLPALTSQANLLQRLASLRVVSRWAVNVALTDGTSMFDRCSSLQSLPSGMTLGAVTNGTSMFDRCTSLQSLPSGMTLGAVTNGSYMFYACTSLQSLPSGMTLGAVTNGTQMFNNCTSLQSLPSGMTLGACNTTTSMFASCSSLQAADGLAIPESFSIASCNFSAAALDALYTSLPTVTGKTITVTGNPGTSGDDPSIATAKGWTVAGS